MLLPESSGLIMACLISSWSKGWQLVGNFPVWKTLSGMPIKQQLTHQRAPSSASRVLPRPLALARSERSARTTNSNRRPGPYRGARRQRGCGSSASWPETLDPSRMSRWHASTTPRTADYGSIEFSAPTGSLPTRPSSTRWSQCGRSSRQKLGWARADTLDIVIEATRNGFGALRRKRMLLFSSCVAPDFPYVQVIPELSKAP
jgi:hypothetical protein